jgi:hypothetical protein
MEDPERLRRRAQRIRTLAGIAGTPYVAEALKDLAREIELEAIKAEIRAMFETPQAV